MANKNYRCWLFAAVLLFSISRVQAQRNWLQHSITQERPGRDLAAVEGWRKTEKQAVLSAIKEIPERVRSSLVRNGGQYLNYAWPALPATQFLEFAQNGNRSRYESSLGKRRQVLSALIIAELTEQKGRFLPQIVNGIWATCEESTWALPAHLYLQKETTPLPNPGEHIIDLGDGMTASMMSWAYLLLRDKLDSITPLIAQRMRYELDRRVIEPFLQRSDFWWMGFEGQSVNNWNPWVNKNVLLTALLTEEDGRRLDSTVYKTMRSVDFFINQYPADGGCDEGPSYWSEAGGKLIFYLNLLKAATGGETDITNYPLICNMGRYIYRVNIDKHYFVDFADAHPALTPDVVSVFEFGSACHDDTLKQFAAYFAKENGDASGYLLQTRDNLRAFVDYLKIYREISAVPPALPLVKEAWLPDLQVLTVRSKAGSSGGLFLGAKGGTNGESHNHNDVGNFIIYADGKPAIIDIGVGTYTRQTFSGDRYQMFTMQSAWHNLPTVNGVMQQAGGQYKAEGVKLYHDRKGTHLSLNIAGAYPPKAGIKSWERSLSFDGQEITLKEAYKLQAYEQPFELSLITPLQVSVEGSDIILKEETNHYGLKIHFDPRQFRVQVEDKPLEDPRLLHAWHSPLKRILMKDLKGKLTGEYTLVFQSLH